MDILGIGPLEFVFILLIALIVLGPNDMVKAGRTIGRLLRKLVTSPGWQMVQQTSKDIRYLPNKLMREAGLEELKDKMPTSQQITKDIGLNELKKEVKDLDKDLSAWTTPPLTINTPKAPPTGSPAKVVPENIPAEEPAPEQTIEPPQNPDESGSN